MYRLVRQMVLVLVTAVLIATTTAFASYIFTDVDDNAYYADAIQWAVSNGVTNGIGNNQFGVNSNVTRSQAVTFLWRAVGKPTPKTKTNPFKDVESGSWYEQAVLWAVENNITNGVGDGRFDPEGAVTRGQMITFLYRAKGSPLGSGGAWYEAAENWARSKGLLAGTARAYGTNADCPRCDVVLYIWREVNSGSGQGSQSGNTNNQDSTNNQSSTNNQGNTDNQGSIEPNVDNSTEPSGGRGDVSEEGLQVKF